MPITRNNFSKGFNSDIDVRAIDPSSYIDGRNFTIVGNGNFFSATNIKGTEFIHQVIDSDPYTNDNITNLNILANIEAEFIFQTSINGSFKRTGICYILTRSNPTIGVESFYEIYVYDIQGDAIHKIYTETIDSNSNIIDDGTIDHIVFSENNVDFIYFTDMFNPIRKLRCEVQLSLYTMRDITLRRFNTLSSVRAENVIDGGTLSTGSYQASYRLINSENNIQTKWSQLSNPISMAVISDDNSTSSGDLDGFVNKSIRFDVDITNDDTAFYDYIQLSVIRNPSNGLSATSASKLPPRTIASGLSGSIYQFTYTGDDRRTLIPIEDITVEDAAIQNVGTLTTKRNRLIAGNIKYNPLDYDRGDISINPMGTSVIKRDIGNPSKTISGDIGYRSAVNTANYRGYFRDEVYRFAISYHDEFGNYSEPQALSFPSLTFTDNRSTSDDWKFPKRQDADGAISNGYSLLNSSNNIDAIGLRIQEISNHPTWARGFKILRAKRKKNIAFQSPLIYTSVVEPALAKAEYPPEGGSVPNPLGTLVPKNFFYGVARHIRRRLNYTLIINQGDNEVNWTFERGLGSNRVSLVFPPELIYRDDESRTVGSYTHSENDQSVIIDYAALHLNYDRYDPQITLSSGKNTQPGDSLASNVSGQFYASDNTDYYYERSKTTVDPVEAIYGSTDFTSSNIIEAAIVENFQSTTPLTKVYPGLDQRSFGDFNSLQGTPVEGSTPDNQRALLIGFRRNLIDPAFFATNVVSGDANMPRRTGQPTDIFRNTLQITAGQINVANIDGSFGDTTNQYIIPSTEAAVISVVPIINVEKGLNDDRYGEKDSFHEFISTGTYRGLTETEVSSNTAITVDVWGGDCFINLHHFKLTNSTYSITDPESEYTNTGFDVEDLNIEKWGNFYANEFNEPTKRPIPLAGTSQVISVFLESEVNADYRSQDTYRNIGSISTPQIIDQSSGTTRIPFDYEYNLSYSKENDYKIFIPRDVLFRENNEFVARIAYSDQKVYQTDVEGFDIFRVANIFDMDESYGKMTKLGLQGDDVYGIQEKGIVYIPVESNVIETTDQATLSIQTGQVIGRPRYIDTLNGSSLIRSIKTDKDSIYFADDRNKMIGRIIGGQTEMLSDLGQDSLFDNIFSVQNIDPTKIASFYDPNENEYAIWNDFRDGDVTIYSDKLKFWMSRWSINGEILKSGIYVDKDLYLLGLDNDGDLNIEKMYSGNFGEFFGVRNNSYIDFVVNQDPNIPKVFDNILIESSQRLLCADFNTFRDSYAVNQSAVGMNLDTRQQLEGIYRIKILRDSQNARLRGLYGTCRLYWDNDATHSSSLHAVTTKFRHSHKII